MLLYCNAFDRSVKWDSQDGSIPEAIGHPFSCGKCLKAEVERIRYPVMGLDHCDVLICGNGTPLEHAVHVVEIKVAEKLRSRKEKDKGTLETSLIKPPTTK